MYQAKYNLEKKKSREELHLQSETILPGLTKHRSNNFIACPSPRALPLPTPPLLPGPDLSDF